MRRAPTAGSDEIGWDPERGRLDPADLEGVDAVIHLAGESIASGRWTRARRERILRSRSDGTQLLAETLAGLSRKPRVFVSASAVGFYGDRGDEIVDEQSASGSGFLAEVCRAWEAASEPAAKAGIRVVPLRIGIVLSASGGALSQMLLPARLGLGGPMGSGSAWFSWIALDDLIGLMHHLLFTESIAGPVNAVAPEPVRSAELARVLGRVLRRPAFLRVPAFALRAALGDLADEALLASARVRSARLTGCGFEFLYPDLESALRCELGVARG